MADIHNDRVFLEELYETHAESLFRYAYALLGNAEDAEDAVGEVFIGVARGIQKASKLQNPHAYLIISTRNAAYEILRKKRNRTRLSESLSQEMRHRSTHCEVDTIILNEALSKLPVEQREVLALKIFEQMTLKEIAATVGARLNTVASRYRYAIDRLKQVLESESNG